MLMGEGEMDVAKRIRTSYRGKVSGKGTGSRVEVGPALTEERKQNTWRGVKVWFLLKQHRGEYPFIKESYGFGKNEPKPSDLDQGRTIFFFCKGPNSKYLRLCRPCGFCCNCNRQC